METTTNPEVQVGDQVRVLEARYVAQATGRIGTVVEADDQRDGIRVTLDDDVRNDHGERLATWLVRRWEKVEQAEQETETEPDPVQAKYDQLVALIVDQAVTRGWGTHLVSVFEAAGVPMPRVTVQALVDATKTMHDYQAYLHPWWDQAVEGNEPVHKVTLHRKLRLELTPPEDVTPGCHCTERDEDGHLPGWARDQIVDQAVDALGGPRSGWHALHTDVELSCAWCV